MSTLVIQTHLDIIVETKKGKENIVLNEKRTVQEVS